jgi:hypothetical protein
MAPSLVFQQGHGRLVSLAAVDLDFAVISRHPVVPLPASYTIPDAVFTS